MNAPLHPLAAPAGDCLITVEDLSVAYGPAGTARVVDRLCFEMRQGQVTAIVGESGSGKTMAARAILGLLPSPLKVERGAIRFEGADLTRASPDALRRVRGRRIGMVFQEPMVSLNPALTIGRQLTEGLALHRSLSKAEARARAGTMLRRIGIPDVDAALRAFPHEFSGGMRQRIMLASVMLCEPSLLIADEPTTALDALSQAEVLDLMMALTREAQTAVLLISHDLALVARYASEVVVMRGGQGVDRGPTRDILLSPRIPYTRELVGALPRRWPSRPVPDELPSLVEVREVEIVYPARRWLFRRSAAKQAVAGVSLHIRPGETLALVGGSGSGKTTLGRAILGLAPLARGEIRFEGESIASLSRADLGRFRQACQLVYQDPFSSLDPRMRVGAIVAEPLRLDKELDVAERRRRAEAMLAEVGLDGFSGRFPHQLSGGQRQRVAIARALVRRPRLVVADEPVSALDVTVQKQVLALLRGLKEAHGFAMLFISHDLGVVEEVADRVAVMEKGRIVEAGRKEDVLDRPQHPYTCRLLAASHRLVATEGALVLSGRLESLTPARGMEPGKPYDETFSETGGDSL